MPSQDSCFFLWLQPSRRGLKGQAYNPKAPAVRREAEEDWGSGAGHSMKLRAVWLLAYFREFSPLGSKQDQLAALYDIFGLAC
jgi:hypothetical protein